MTMTVQFGLPNGFAGLPPRGDPVELERAIQRLLDVAPPNTDRSAEYQRLVALTESLRAADILATGCASLGDATVFLTIGIGPVLDVDTYAGELAERMPAADVQVAEVAGGTAVCAVYLEGDWCRAHAVVVDEERDTSVVLEAACDRIGDEFCQVVAAVLDSVRVRT